MAGPLVFGRTSTQIAFRGGGRVDFILIHLEDCDDRRDQLLQDLFSRSHHGLSPWAILHGS
jgi:hypothetical protein